MTPLSVTLTVAGQVSAMLRIEYSSALDLSYNIVLLDRVIVATASGVSSSLLGTQLSAPKNQILIKLNAGFESAFLDPIRNHVGLTLALQPGYMTTSLGLPVLLRDGVFPITAEILGL